MQTCDVLIVGGGPAGSSCARALAGQGMDVLVVDKATFPRDKVCAGWVTPAVFADLGLDPAEYGQGRTCQAITAFRCGMAPGRKKGTVPICLNGPEGDSHKWGLSPFSVVKELSVDYGRPVSYGIRRSEFDHFLLQRCGARLSLGQAVGQAVRSVRRSGGTWVVDDRVSAPMLVAAGGHFCPVARQLGGTADGCGPVVAAQEIEFELSGPQKAACPVEPGVPEIYFCEDLAGYGWCVRKGDFLNVGLGREDPKELPQHVGRFCDWLKSRGRIPAEMPAKLHGHAYYLYPHSPRRLSDDGLVLVGDAAGLAYAASGEGIRPAVESGLVAARVIAAAGGHYDGANLKAYDDQIAARFGRRNVVPSAPRPTVTAFRQRLAARLLATRWFTRRVVLDRWFLHLHEPPMAPGVDNPG